MLNSLPSIEYLSADKESCFEKVKMDITNIQYEDNTFDVVLCNHILENIENDGKAMREIYRVLKPGGVGYFTITC